MAAARSGIAVALVAACGIFLLAGCGGGSSNPTAPSVAAPTINGSTDLIYVGQSVTFSASGTGVRWGGDAPAVATVDASTGVVTAVGVGRVTIWAENGGGRATRLLRSLPSFNGSWSGSYAITDCQSTGDFAAIRFCGSFYRGQVLNMRFQITQTRDQVTGSFSLGDLQGSLNGGTVNEDGSLPLTGSLTSSSTTVQLQNVRLTSPSAGTMKGQFDQLWSASGLTGTGRVMCDIRDLTRSSGAPTATAMGLGAALPALTMEEVVNAVLRRQ